MPKLSHEALVHLVRAAPEAIVALVGRTLAIDLPLQVQPRITAAELVDLNLAEYRADAVITLGPADQPDEAFVVEAQGEADARKRRTWPLYVTGARALASSRTGGAVGGRTRPRTGRRAHRLRRHHGRARPRQ